MSLLGMTRREASMNSQQDISGLYKHLLFLAVLLFAGPAGAQPDADFVLQWVDPLRVCAGETFDHVAIRMSNTGDTEWYAEPPNGIMYGLGVRPDPDPDPFWTPTRMWILGDDTVVPGQGYTFQTTLTVTDIPGTYTFQWRMTEANGFGWFGNHTDSLEVEVMPIVPDSEFVDQEIPLEPVEPDSTFDVSITMENTGCVTWSAAGGHMLGSQNPQDNGRWGTQRIYMGTGHTVEPGQTYTFTATLTAPHVPGLYDFQWRMTEGAGYGWFGETTGNIQIQVAGCTLRNPQSTEEDGGDWGNLQAVLNAGQDLVLCPNTTYYLEQRLTYETANQKIYTAGFHWDLERPWNDDAAMAQYCSSAHEHGLDSKATLVVAKANADYDGPEAEGRAIFCRRTDINDDHPVRNVHLVGVEIRGTSLAPLVHSEFPNSPPNSMVLFACEGAHVSCNEMKLPNSPCALHMTSAGRDPITGEPECTDAIVHDNMIGPAGKRGCSSDPVNDWADGIRAACAGTYVKNIITDATDVGIAVFSSNVTVTHNDVLLSGTYETPTLEGCAGGGISMADCYGQTCGATNIKIAWNYVNAEPMEPGSPWPRIDRGIALGNLTWHCEDLLLDGAGTSVMDNIVTGNVAFGMAFNGISDVVVRGNTVATRQDIDYRSADTCDPILDICDRTRGGDIQVALGGCPWCCVCDPHTLHEKDAFTWPKHTMPEACPPEPPVFGGGGTWILCPDCNEVK